MRVHESSQSMSIVSLRTKHVHGQIWSQHDLDMGFPEWASHQLPSKLVEAGGDFGIGAAVNASKWTTENMSGNGVEPLNPLESLNNTFVAFVWLHILDVWHHGIMASSYQIPNISKYLMYPDHGVKVAMIQILRPPWLLPCLRPWLLPWLLWLLPWLLPTLVLNLAVISDLEHLHLHRSVAE